MVFPSCNSLRTKFSHIWTLLSFCTKTLWGEIHCTMVHLLRQNQLQLLMFSLMHGTWHMSLFELARFWQCKTVYSQQICPFHSNNLLLNCYFSHFMSFALYIPSTVWQRIAGLANSLCCLWCTKCNSGWASQPTAYTHIYNIRMWFTQCPYNGLCSTANILCIIPNWSSMLSRVLRDRQMLICTIWFGPFEGGGMKLFC